MAFCVRKINFNSHAHVERDTMKNIIERNENISTHTLTWSVTHVGQASMPKAGISTHTLTWSVTRLLSLPMNVQKHFNSHAHVERDLNSITTITPAI